MATSPEPEPDLLDARTLITYLEKLTDEEKEAIRVRSYRHPNGFVKIVLRKNSDGSLFRLHYWLKELAMEQNCHDHGWHFTSKILRGALTNMNYTKREQTDVDDVDAAVYEYTMDLSKHDRKLHVTRSEQKYMLEIESERTYRAGDVYQLSPDVIHKGHPRQEDTITVVRQEPLSKSCCHLYTTDEVPDGHRFDPISTHELNNIFFIVQACVPYDNPTEPRSKFHYTMPQHVQRQEWYQRLLPLQTEKELCIYLDDTVTIEDRLCMITAAPYVIQADKKVLIVSPAKRYSYYLEKDISPTNRRDLDRFRRIWRRAPFDATPFAMTLEERGPTVDEPFYSFVIVHPHMTSKLLRSAAEDLFSLIIVVDTWEYRRNPYIPQIIDKFPSAKVLVFTEPPDEYL